MLLQAELQLLTKPLSQVPGTRGAEKVRRRGSQVAASIMRNPVGAAASGAGSQEALTGCRWACSVMTKLCPTKWLELVSPELPPLLQDPFLGRAVQRPQTLNASVCTAPSVQPCTSVLHGPTQGWSSVAMRRGTGRLARAMGRVCTIMTTFWKSKPLQTNRSLDRAYRPVFPHHFPGKCPGCTLGKPQAPWLP